MLGNELSDRKKTILRAIIEAHIMEGEPVGSKYILEHTELSCSSATIRNEMAELESLGYLDHPHTSAGRVPSVSGYRFYVDSLMERYAMTTYELAQIHGALKSKLLELDSILDLASRLASNLTNYTGIALKPAGNVLTVSRYETVFLSPNSFILVMILSNTEVKSKQFSTKNELTPEMIRRVGEALNSNLINMTANEITLPCMMKAESDAGEDCSEIMSLVMRYISKSLSDGGANGVRLSGLNRLLDYPEFSDSDKLKKLIGRLESGDGAIGRLVAQGDDDLKVYIGSESTVEEMNDSAFVFKPIKLNGKTIGAIGVIGPLRMDYGKVLATIDSLSGNINSLISENKLLADSTEPLDEEKPD